MTNPAPSAAPRRLELIRPTAGGLHLETRAVRTPLDLALLLHDFAAGRGIELRHEFGAGTDREPLLIREPGKLWRRATDVDRLRLAHELATVVRYADTADRARRHIRDENARTPLRTAADRLESVRPVLEAFRLLSALPGVAVPAADVDAAPDLVGTASGVLDLRTGELDRFRSGALITRALEVPFDPAAPAPRWLRFIDETFGDSADFVRRVFGYALTGHTTERVLLVLAGEESPAKRVLREVLADVFGELHHEASAGVLDAGSASPLNELALMRPARLVHVRGPRSGGYLDEALVSRMTGAEMITAARKYDDPFHYRPSFLLMLSAPARPNPSTLDPGFLDRVLVLDVPADADASGVREALADERAGVLAWLVRGALEWHRGGLAAPAAVEADTAAYRADANPLAAYLEEHFERTGDHGETLAREEVWGGYERWCSTNGEDFLKWLPFRAAVEDWTGFPSYKPRNRVTFRGLRRR